MKSSFFLNWFWFLYITVVKFSLWLITRSPFSPGEPHCFWKLSSVVMLGRKYYSEDPESCSLWPSKAISKVEIWKLLWRLKRNWYFYLVNPLDTVNLTVNLVTTFPHASLKFSKLITFKWKIFFLNHNIWDIKISLRETIQHWIGVLLQH